MINIKFTGRVYHKSKLLAHEYVPNMIAFQNFSHLIDAHMYMLIIESTLITVRYIDIIHISIMIGLKKTCILKGLLKSNRKLQVHLCAYIVLYDYVKYLHIKSMVKYNRQVYKNGY